MSSGAQFSLLETNVKGHWPHVGKEAASLTPQPHQIFNAQLVGQQMLKPARGKAGNVDLLLLKV